MTDETTATPTAVADDPAPGTPVTETVDPTEDRPAEELLSASEGRRAKAREIAERHRTAQEEGGGAEPTSESPAARAEASDEDAPAEAPPPAPTRYRDPETKKFISKEEAERRGIEPEAPTAGNADGPTGGEPEGETPAAGDPIVVKGPARDGSDYEVVLPADTPPQTIETIQGWARNGQRRAEHIRQMEAVEQDRAELDEFKELVSTDPAGVILAHLPAESRVSLARALLAEDAVFDALVEDVDRWDRDPAARQRARLEAENDRLREEQKRRDAAAQRARAEQSFREVRDAVVGMIPDDAPDQEADAFFRDAMRDLSDFQRSQRRAPTPADLPKLLARRLSLYGWTARDDDTPPTPSDGPQGPGAAKGSTVDPRKKQRLTTAPAGVGAAGSAGNAVPKDITLGKGGTRDYLKKRFGLSR